MEMKRISSGKLRAIGYTPAQRTLRVELADGTVLEYVAVGEETWRRLQASSSPWSYYRDHIEEEFTARRTGSAATKGRNPLDDLFGD